VNEVATDKPPYSDTLFICCPICESDAAETLGVTGNVRGELAATVIMCCNQCHCVYLTPRPDAAGSSTTNDSEIDNLVQRKRTQLLKAVPTGTTFLNAEEQPAMLMQRDPGKNRFDRILLPHTLESAEAPVALMRHVCALAEAGGKVELLLSKAQSSCFSFFCGRHWYGYRFPHARQMLGIDAVRVLAEHAGFTLQDKRTLFSADAWRISFRNWLSDWGMPPIMIVLLAGRWGGPWIVAALFESVAALRGRAAVLHATLESNNGR
jgi:hypothetical protein